MLRILFKSWKLETKFGLAKGQKFLSNTEPELKNVVAKQKIVI